MLKIHTFYVGLLRLSVNELVFRQELHTYWQELHTFLTRKHDMLLGM